MRRQVVAFTAGLLFGLGLVISEMINPAKVLAFLDVAGAWDPSLALVMAGALLATAVGYRWVLAQPKPLYESRFQLPTKQSLDVRLIVGAGVFGMGWGLVGYCPGPALAAVGVGSVSTVLFVMAMLVGMGLFEWFNQHHAAKRLGGPILK